MAHANAFRSLRATFLTKPVVTRLEITPARDKVLAVREGYVVGRVPFTGLESDDLPQAFLDCIEVNESKYQAYIKEVQNLDA